MRRSDAPALWLVRAAVATVALASVAGCGIPLDDTPRGLTSTTTSTTAAPEPTSVGASGVEDTATTAFVFFVADNQLINLEVDVAGVDAADTLAALFAGLPTNASKDIVSQIPTGTRLLDVRQVGTTAVVDVSTEFDNLVGTGRTQAIAQIVMTATDLSGIDQVALRIDGQPTQVFSPERGDVDQVGPCDYLGLLPDEEVVSTWPVDRRSRQHMVTRRNMLRAQCSDAPSAG